MNESKEHVGNICSVFKIMEQLPILFIAVCSAYAMCVFLGIQYGEGAFKHTCYSKHIWEIHPKIGAT